MKIYLFLEVTIGAFEFGIEEGNVKISSNIFLSGIRVFILKTSLIKNKESKLGSYIFRAIKHSFIFLAVKCHCMYWKVIVTKFWLWIGLMRVILLQALQIAPLKFTMLTSKIVFYVKMSLILYSKCFEL